MLKKGMESLGDKQKRVLELAYSEGLLIKEIAERMGEPVQQVRSYYYRGLKKLREVLQQLYPFGYGLSYTTFHYDEVEAESPKIAADGTVSVSARVTNTGKVAGDEVVQVYLTHPGAEGAPIRALAGFQRVHLEAGASKTIKFSLRDSDLSIVDADGVRRIVPGEVKVWIGGGQPIMGPLLFDYATVQHDDSIHPLERGNSM